MPLIEEMGLEEITDELRSRGLTFCLVAEVPGNDIFSSTTPGLFSSYSTGCLQDFPRLMGMVEIAKNHIYRTELSLDKTGE